MKKFLKTFALVSSMSIVATIANADQFVRMVSGPSGGSWYPLGAKVMQTLESNIKGYQHLTPLVVVYQMLCL